MIKISKSILAELESILTIDQLCFEQSVGDVEIKYHILHKDCLCISAYFNGFHSAYCTVKFSKYKTIAFIGRLAVVPGHHKKGIGKALLQNVEEEVRKVGARSIRLQVKQSNSNAIDFYKRNNYNILSELPDFYGKNLHAYNMEKLLNAD